jgi:hypothetical protein
MGIEVCVLRTQGRSEAGGVLFLLLFFDTGETHCPQRNLRIENRRSRKKAHCPITNTIKQIKGFNTDNKKKKKREAWDNGGNHFK